MATVHRPASVLPSAVWSPDHQPGDRVWRTDALLIALPSHLLCSPSKPADSNLLDPRHPPRLYPGCEEPPSCCLSPVLDAPGGTGQREELKPKEPLRHPAMLAPLPDPKAPDLGEQCREGGPLPAAPTVLEASWELGGLQGERPGEGEGAHAHIGCLGRAPPQAG